MRDTILSMNKPTAIKVPPTKVEGIRLRPEMWPKFRDVLRSRGRAWLEKIIEREHLKLPGQK